MTNNLIVVKQSAVIQPNINSVSTVYQTGNIIEIITPNRSPPKLLSNYRKISNDYYLNTTTGKLLKYKHLTNRVHSIYGLKKTFANLRRLLNNNLLGNHSELFITLTYSKHMNDPKQLYSDFKNFWLRLKYRYPYIEYINICEPQSSGSWHCHTFLIRTDNKKLYIPHEELHKCWGHGFVYIERIKYCDNIGAYFSARFTDIDINENNSNSVSEKKIEKGKRLLYYPPNFKFYRCSRGIKRPAPTKMLYKNALKIAENFYPSYSYTNNICRINDDGVIQNINNVTYQQFKIKKEDNK